MSKSIWSQMCTVTDKYLLGNTSRDQACMNSTVDSSLQLHLSGTVHRALQCTDDSLAAGFLCLVPVPRQQAEHTGGHTHAVLRTVTEALVKCVVLTHPDRGWGRDRASNVSRRRENSLKRNRQYTMQCSVGHVIAGEGRVAEWRISVRL